MAKHKLMFTRDSRPDFNLIFTPLITELNRLSFAEDGASEAVTAILEAYRQSMITLCNDGIEKSNLPLMIIIHNTKDYFSIHRSFRKYFIDNGLSNTTLQAVLDIRKKIADKARSLLNATPMIADMSDALLLLEELSTDDLIFMLNPPQKKMREELVAHIERFADFKYVQTVADVRTLLDAVANCVRPAMLDGGLETRFVVHIDYLSPEDLDKFAHEFTAFKVYLSAEIYARINQFIAKKIARFEAHDFSLSHFGAKENFLNNLDAFKTFISDNPPTMIQHIIRSSIQHAGSRAPEGSEASRRFVAEYRQLLYALYDEAGIISQYTKSLPTFELENSNSRLVSLLALTNCVMNDGETANIYFANSMDIFSQLCKIIHFDRTNLGNIVQIYNLAKYHNLQMIMTALEQVAMNSLRTIKNHFTQFLLLVRLAECDPACIASARTKNRLFESVKNMLLSNLEIYKEREEAESTVAEHHHCIFETYTNETNIFTKHIMMALIELLGIPKQWIAGAEADIHPAGGMLSYYNHHRLIGVSQSPELSEPAQKRPRI